MAAVDRKVLEDYIDRRIKLNGMLSKITTNKPPGEPFQVALLEDIWVELAGGVRHFIGHAWVQRAETLKDAKIGDRIECTVTVKHYRKRSQITGDTTLLDYSLRYPNDVRIVKGPPVYTTAQSIQGSNGQTIKHTADPIKIIMDAKAAADKVGGWERIKQLEIMILSMGGFEAFDRLRKDAEAIGGWDKFTQLMEVLNATK